MEPLPSPPFRLQFVLSARPRKRVFSLDKSATLGRIKRARRLQRSPPRGVFPRLIIVCPPRSWSRQIGSDIYLLQSEMKSLRPRTLGPPRRRSFSPGATLQRRVPFPRLRRGFLFLPLFSKERGGEREGEHNNEKQLHLQAQRASLQTLLKRLSEGKV